MRMFQGVFKTCCTCIYQNFINLLVLEKFPRKGPGRKTFPNCAPQTVEQMLIATKWSSPCVPTEGCWEVNHAYQFVKTERTMCVELHDLARPCSSSHEWPDNLELDLGLFFQNSSVPNLSFYSSVSKRVATMLWSTAVHHVIWKRLRKADPSYLVVSLLELP